MNFSKRDPERKEKNKKVRSPSKELLHLNILTHCLKKNFIIDEVSMEIIMI